LYKADTPTNLFPSIHVYNSLGVHFAITKSESLRNKKRIKALSFILCTSIILSTMFLKQHSFFDVITAFAMAAVLYGLIYVKTTREQKSFKKQLRRI
ncbi:MAG: phosphatase PAP2 family protein, partial [Lachnospiraceae bacterium]|nr:phosphatase PAP2 family protein [Lachnospiraceae bacterium]